MSLHTALWDALTLLTYPYPYPYLYLYPSPTPVGISRIAQAQLSRDLNKDRGMPLVPEFRCFQGD